MYESEITYFTMNVYCNYKICIVKIRKIIFKTCCDICTWNIKRIEM